MLTVYPEQPAERDRWILARPAAIAAELDPLRPYAFFAEEECSADGTVHSRSRRFSDEPGVPVALRDVRSVEEHACGIRSGRRDPGTDRLCIGAPPAARQIKLYNSGSFFDPRAIPVEDFPAIADRVKCV